MPLDAPVTIATLLESLLIFTIVLDPIPRTANRRGPAGRLSSYGNRRKHGGHGTSKATHYLRAGPPKHLLRSYPIERMIAHPTSRAANQHMDTMSRCGCCFSFPPQEYGGHQGLCHAWHEEGMDMTRSSRIDTKLESQGHAIAYGRAYGMSSQELRLPPDMFEEALKITIGAWLDAGSNPEWIADGLQSARAAYRG
jgi:hypothetical protein